MRWYLLIPFLLPSLTHSSTPCSIGGVVPGIWNGTVQKEALGEKPLDGDYWSLSCNVDSANWIQIVQRVDKRQPKVLLTFKANRFSCQTSKTSSMCDIVTDIVVQEGRQPLTFSARRDVYKCKEADGDPRHGICINTHPLFIAESDFNKAADSMDIQLALRTKRGWGKAPKSIVSALPQERIHVELKGFGFKDSLLYEVRDYLEIKNDDLRKKNVEWVDAFSKDLDGDGIPESVKQVILENPESGKSPGLRKRAYVIAISSKSNRLLRGDYLFNTSICLDPKKGGLAFQFLPHPTNKKASMIELKKETTTKCRDARQFSVQRDTITWMDSTKRLVHNMGTMP